MAPWDVLVVGAGPSGAASAMQLAALGYRTAMVDRAHFPREKACAEYMSPGVQDVAERLGIAVPIRSAGAVDVPGMEIVSPRGCVLRVQYEAGGIMRSASTLSRHVLDATLVSHAADKGVSVIEGFVARRPLMQGNTVVGVSGSHGGKESPLSARLTIIADGSRSVLAHSLGLTVAPRWPVRLGLVAHFAGKASLREGFGQMHVGEGGYCGIAPLPNGLLNVALVVRADATRLAGQPPSHYFDRWISSHPSLRQTLAGCTRVTSVRGVGPIGARTRRPWVAGAMVVGDAAGFFDPFTGEGIYRALRSAELAAGVAGQALEQSDVSGRILGLYGSLRREAFRSKQWVVTLVQLFVQYPSLMEYALPRLARRERTARALGAVLGDCADARSFLNIPMLWSALHP